MAQALATRYGFSGQEPARRPDLGRISAISGTLALNLGALLLLLMPAQQPMSPLLPFDSGRTTVDFRPSVAPPPPPVVPPPPVRPVQPRAITPAAPVTPPLAPPVTVDAGAGLPAPAIPTTVQPLQPATSLSGDPAAQAGTGAGAGESGALAYVAAPPPRYPPEALRNGWQGTVWLQVQVGADGRPTGVVIERSSGHRVLDQEAQRQVLRHWRFQPAMRDGVAVPAQGRIPIDFALGAR